MREWNWPVALLGSFVLYAEEDMMCVGEGARGYIRGIAADDVRVRATAS